MSDTLEAVVADEADGGGFQTGEREVRRSALDPRSRQTDGAGVAAARQPIHHRSAGVRQTKGLSDLVETLAGGVVPCPTEAARLTIGEEVPARVAPRGDEGQHSLRCPARGRAIEIEKRRDQMAVEVIHRHERQTAGPGVGTGETNSHQEGAHQTRTGRNGHQFNLALSRAEGSLEAAPVGP